MTTKVKYIADNVVTVDQIDLSTLSTSNVSEGTNLYYTDARVGAYLTANSYATQSYVGTELANLVDSSPATLDTLNELAAALGDDPNFATTVSTSIGTKWTQDNTKISNWDTAYTYSQVGHLPLAGGTITGALEISQAANNYVSIVGNGSYEAMTRYINSDTSNWYAGIRTSAGIGSTTGFHIYSSALGDDAFALDTSGNGFFNASVRTNNILYRTGTSGLKVGGFTDANTEETGGTVVTWLRTGTWDNYVIKGPTGRGVFGTQFIGEHISDSKSWGVFSTGWDTELQVNGDGRLYMKGPVGIGYTPTSTSDYKLRVNGTVYASSTFQNPSIWINDGSNYNDYNENVRLFDPSNGGPSVIAFGASGTGGLPRHSILSYSDTTSYGLDFRVGATPYLRMRNGKNDFLTQTTVTSSGTGGSPTLDVINTSATTFNHSMEVMTPNMTTGQTNILVLGRESSTRNAGYLGYNFSGTAGSNSNYLSLGHWGNDNLVRLYGDGNLQIMSGTIDKVAYNKAFILRSSGTSSSGSAIGFQQLTAEGWTGIFVDYNPYEGWGLYHDNPSNFFYITAEVATNNIGTSFTVPNRDSGTSTAYAKIRFNQNNGNIDLGGNLVAYGSVTANASDQRLKENLIPIENAVEKIKRLNGLYFDWKADLIDSVGFSPDIRQNDVGLIAQEVQAVLPQAVTRAPFDTKVVSTPIDRKNKNTGNVEEYSSLTGEEYLTIRYEKLVPLLVAAIKEQAEKIEALEARVQQLET